MGEFSMNTQWEGVRFKDHKFTLEKPEQKNEKTANLHS